MVGKKEDRFPMRPLAMERLEEHAKIFELDSKGKMIILFEKRKLF